MIFSAPAHSTAAKNGNTSVGHPLAYSLGFSSIVMKRPNRYHPLKLIGVLDLLLKDHRDHKDRFSSKQETGFRSEFAV